MRVAVLMYCARTVAENGEKDAFSVISDDEWNPYIFQTQKKNGKTAVLKVIDKNPCGLNPKAIFSA